MLMERHGHVTFNPLSDPICTAADARILIDEADFVATYKRGRQPEAEYPPVAAARAAYEDELRTWTRETWPIPYGERRPGPANTLITLIAVLQQMRGKVLPMPDFLELNIHINTFPANNDVFADDPRVC
ncbi:hypothetical protein TTRE_0000580101 [Trichuris trichiura]|uniref:Uncharacterized protein n=1 Tax=Trichuris trichiura TaxID=36087 RepID=A0A077ZCD3_TRITR|nr:hypothetical protein TTRE_0000580101 [Trichuris trichiura]